MSAEDRYCIDTSALIHAWRRAYPIRNFGPIWERLDGLIEEERLVSSTEVLAEIKKKDDELHEWAKDRDAMFLDIGDDDIQHKMAEIMGAYPRLVDTRKNRDAADPFVIAHAAIADPPLLVVTQEGPTNNLEKPNIPDVCTAEGITSINILELITREDWVL